MVKQEISHKDLVKFDKPVYLLLKDKKTFEISKLVTFYKFTIQDYSKKSDTKSKDVDLKNAADSNKTYHLCKLPLYMKKHLPIHSFTFGSPSYELELITDMLCTSVDLCDLVSE
jgi:hypothetical protein